MTSHTAPALSATLNQHDLRRAINRDRRLSACDRACVGEIIDWHHADYGDAWICYDILHDKTGFSRSQLIRSVKRLREIGYIKLLAKGVRGVGRKGRDGDKGKWFARADLMNPPPFLKNVIYSADELPETLHLYRGGSSKSDLLELGYSWSPNRDTACAYATDRVCTYGGDPVVVTAQIPKASLVMATRTPEGEFVTLDQHAVEDSITDRKQIRDLAEAHVARRLAPGGEGMIALSLEDEECWHGWTGDYDK